MIQMIEIQGIDGNDEHNGDDPNLRLAAAAVAEFKAFVTARIPAVLSSIASGFISLLYASPTEKETGTALC
jgi:hypothetical protein